jgi:hypothetical protein
MPVSSATDPEPKIVSMKVGERRKIKSKTILTEFSPGFMMGPSHYLRSSDSRVVTIEGNSAGPVAWVRAISPGNANIQHTDDGRITPVVVEQEGEQVSGGNGGQRR